MLFCLLRHHYDHVLVIAVDPARLVAPTWLLSGVSAFGFEVRAVLPTGHSHLGFGLGRCTGQPSVSRETWALTTTDHPYR